MAFLRSTLEAACAGAGVHKLAGFFQQEDIFFIDGYVAQMDGAVFAGEDIDIGVRRLHLAHGEHAADDPTQLMDKLSDA